MKEHTNGIEVGVQIRKLLLQSNLPRKVMLEDFDFSGQHSFSARAMEELAAGRCLDRNESILIFGPAGSGKTHLAATLGRRWCAAGLSVYFEKAHVLARKVCCTESYKKYDDFQALILDDLSAIFSHQRFDGLLDLLQHRRRSVVITTQLDLYKWEALVKRSNAAGSPLDRILERAYIVQLDGSCLYRARPRAPLHLPPIS